MTRAGTRGGASSWFARCCGAHPDDGITPISMFETAEGRCHSGRPHGESAEWSPSGLLKGRCVTACSRHLDVLLAWHGWQEITQKAECDGPAGYCAAGNVTHDSAWIPARFELSRLRRWLRPGDISGHDRPRDEEGEPP